VLFVEEEKKKAAAAAAAAAATTMLGLDDDDDEDWCVSLLSSPLLSSLSLLRARSQVNVFIFISFSFSFSFAFHRLLASHRCARRLLYKLKNSSKTSISFICSFIGHSLSLTHRAI
jgi:hypothetical protein